MRSTPFLRLCLVLLLCIALCCTLTEARRRRGRRGRKAAASRRHHHHRHNRRSHPRPQWTSYDVDDSMDSGDDSWDDEGDDSDWDEGGLADGLDLHSPPSSPSPSARSATTDAHMMLVLQWPESLCAANKRGCQTRVHPHLTIHGLWPVQRRLVHCRPDFDALKMAAMAVHLRDVWPSYFHRTNLQFWQHEYDKHGSCLYATMEEYFAAALALQDRYQLLDIIQPSMRPQPLAAYQRAIKARLGVEPMFMCNTNWLPRREHDSHFSALPAGTRRNEQLLVEVGLCFTADGALRDCPEAGRIRRCSKMRDVLFPPLYTFTQPDDVEPETAAEDEELQRQTQHLELLAFEGA